MVLQVGAVRHKLPDELDGRVGGARAASSRPVARRSPRCAGCSAAMRHDGDDLELAPQPGLDSARRAGRRRSRRAGLPVDAPRRGRARTRSRAAIDLSAYRIVQEGLTNALKHARAQPGRRDRSATRPDELQIEVRDDGAAASASNGPGHGLVGVRERVKIYGGEMTAGAARRRRLRPRRTRLPLGGDGR